LSRQLSRQKSKEEVKEPEKKNETSQLVQEEKAETGTVIIFYYICGVIGKD